MIEQSVEQALQALLESFFNSKMQGVWTAIPCLVTQVHNGFSEQRVDVQPALLRPYADDTEEYPPILNVQVMFPSSSTSSLTMPVSVGDPVLCVFSRVDISSFKGGDGEISVPTTWRQFQYNDAVAIPGLFPFQLSPNLAGNHSLPHSSTDLALSHNIGTAQECRVELKEDGSVFLKNALGTFSISATGEISALSGPSSLTISPTMIDITSPIIMINGVNFSLHTHICATPGNPSGPPV